jgi:hemerythrin-like metal-binding protein
MKTHDGPRALQMVERQHAGVAQRLETFVHHLFDASQRDTVVESLIDLITEMSMHFGFEESLMDDVAYPELDHHRRQHMGIVIELGLLLDRVVAREDLTEVARSADFLTRWYHQHIEHSDGPMMRWCASAA